MSYSISGKTAIITGAANGVGLAIARHFVDQGANVVLVDRDESKLKTEVASFSGADEHAIFFAGDLRERLTLANLLSATVDAFDRVDILVNATRLGNPYTIVAIGDPETLERAVREDSHASLLFDVYSKQYGLQVSLSRATEVSVPAFKGSMRPVYAIPADGGV